MNSSLDAHLTENVNEDSTDAPLPEDSTKSKRAIYIGWLVIIFFLVGVVGYATLNQPAPTSAQKAHSLETQIKCPSCEGLSVADSTSPIAINIRALVLKMIKENKSNSQIMLYLESKYGPSISLSPTGSTVASFTWYIPIFSVVAAFLLIISVAFWRSSLKLKMRVKWLKHRKRLERSSRLRIKIIGLTFIGIGLLYFILSFVGVKLPFNDVGKSTVSTEQMISNARTLANLGQEQAALVIYTQIIQDDPQNATAYAERGWLITQAGAQAHDEKVINEGVDDLNKAILIDPQLSEAHLFLGTVIYQDNHKPSAAIKEYSIFLKYNTNEDLLNASKNEILSCYKAAGITPPHIP